MFPALNPSGAKKNTEFNFYVPPFFFSKRNPRPPVQKLPSRPAGRCGAVTVEQLKKLACSRRPALRTPKPYLKTFIGAEVADWAAMIKASGVTID